MRHPVSIYLAVEDELSEHVLRRVVAEHPTPFQIEAVYRHGGFGYLKQKAAGFNNAAKACPFLLLTDLDTYDCPPALIRDWLSVPANPGFLLRVAVREVESWLLGDLQGLRSFLGVRSAKPLPTPESLADPKAQLLRLAQSGRRRDVREALVAVDARTGGIHQGPDYNGRLAEFVLHGWDLGAARAACGSLARLFAALSRL